MSKDRNIFCGWGNSLQNLNMTKIADTIEVTGVFSLRLFENIVPSLAPSFMP